MNNDGLRRGLVQGPGASTGAGLTRQKGRSGYRANIMAQRRRVATARMTRHPPAVAADGNLVAKPTGGTMATEPGLGPGRVRRFDRRARQIGFAKAAGVTLRGGKEIGAY
ncbi:hypothetical protein NL676_012398 [Syzygium grande]|nr:hypothetical protein NL676_012398 [Syzygium grande]